jgi:undecaprenyl-diphosphatase
VTRDEEHPGLKPALLGGGLVALVVLTLPLGALVRERWGPLLRLDNRLESAFHGDAIRHAWLGTAAKALTQFGAPTLIDVATVALVVVLVRSGRRRTAIYLGACVAGAYLLSTAGKLVVGRARPTFRDAIAHAHGTSFPSGHATGAAAFYLALAVVLLSVLGGRGRGPLLAMAVVVPVVVSATRVVLGVHYLSDVTAGLLIGWGWAAACTALFTAWRVEEGRPAAPLEEGIEPEPAR